MLGNIFNPAGEYELVVIDPVEMCVISYPRRSMRRSAITYHLNDVKAASLFFVAIALYNQTEEYSHSYPDWLERFGVGCELEKRRRASREYHGLVDVYMKVSPGPRVYPITAQAGRVRLLGVRL